MINSESAWRPATGGFALAGGFGAASLCSLEARRKFRTCLGKASNDSGTTLVGVCIGGTPVGCVGGTFIGSTPPAHISLDVGPSISSNPLAFGPVLEQARHCIGEVLGTIREYLDRQVAQGVRRNQPVGSQLAAGDRDHSP